MTIQNTLTSTPFSSAAATSAAERAAASSRTDTAPPASDSASQPQAGQRPAGVGLVGHVINTTA